MATLYSRRPAAGFGNRSTSPKARSKPLKRPVQSRAKFTVQAIYDAFVRIWRIHGWEGITTRAVALETGISVGTLYDYFPNKEALLSGYFRHCIEVLLMEIDAQAIAPEDLPWRQRVHQLVRLTCGIDTPELPYFDAGMLQLETRIAEPKHHRRVYDELSEKWIAAIAACTDLPQAPDATAIRALYLSVWGGRRYLLLVAPPGFDAHAWTTQMEHTCCAALTT